MSSRNYEDFIVGGIASSLSRCVVAPLDVVKIRFQVQKGIGDTRKYRSVTQAIRTIVAEEGVRALWKGNLAALLMIAPWGAISMLVTQQAKAAWHWKYPVIVNDATVGSATNHTITNQDPTPVLSFFASSVGGICATLATYPLDLMRTRLAVQSGESGSRSILGGLRQTFRTSGLRGIYAGLTPTLVGIVPYMGLNFGIYDASRAMLRVFTRKLNVVQQNSESSSLLHSFLTRSEAAISGGIAGTLSKLITMPFDVVKKHMQTASYPHTFDHTPNPALMTVTPNGTSSPGVAVTASSQHLSAWQHVQSLVRTHGMRGLFRGCWPALIKAGPGSAVIFATYEATLRLLIKSRNVSASSNKSKEV